MSRPNPILFPVRKALTLALGLCAFASSSFADAMTGSAYLGNAVLDIRADFGAGSTLGSSDKLTIDFVAYKVLEGSAYYPVGDQYYPKGQLSLLGGGGKELPVSPWPGYQTTYEKEIFLTAGANATSGYFGVPTEQWELGGLNHLIQTYGYQTELNGKHCTENNNATLTIVDHPAKKISMGCANILVETWMKIGQ